MIRPPSETAAPASTHHRVPRWLPDLVLGVVIVATAFLPAPVLEFRTNGATVALVLSSVLLLPWRTRWPVPVLAVLLALFAVTAMLGTLSPGIGLAIAAAVFRLADRGPRRRAFIAAGFVVVSVILLSLPSSISSVFEPRVLQFGLVVALAAVAGDGARSRRDYITAITERAERAERTREAEAQRRVSEERLRIARDLHDAVAHQIAVISLNAGVASSSIDSRPEKAKEALVTIRGAARTVLGEIGDLLGVLRTDDTTSGGDASPQPGLDRLDDLVEQFARVGLDVHTRTEGDLSAVSGTPASVGYRVLQEALTNAHKHGSEHRAHVLVEVTDAALALTVTNPSDASTSRESVESSGLGLVGLRERVAAARGTVDAAPSAGGWKLAARIPLGPGGER
ncbi:sensor histidine kinase [Marisediminicola sp. LYQ85]|uniref:sensor histidine kinase n=1 Tax=Marisediminicola sp. LYQ85 TaxID=3391062 RepID=UPI0039838F2A